MAAGRIGSNPSPTLNPATLPKGEAGERVKDVGPGAGAAGIAALASNQQVDGDSDIGQGLGVNPGRANPNVGVQISQGGKDRIESHKKALNIARATPDVREDKVADFKKRIAEGSYKPDAGNIADGIMHEAIREHLADTER